jgi:hypothetical protein
MSNFILCHYVRRCDPGDLVWGYNWREAVLVWPEFPYVFGKHADIESCMFDKETGEPVGDTGNYCVNHWCSHEDCAPTSLLFTEGLT